MSDSEFHDKNTSSDLRRRRDNGKNDGVILPTPPPSIQIPEDYSSFFIPLKERVQKERLKAVLSANTAQILLYWDMGHDILSKQNNAGWGAKIIDKLSADLKNAFPEMKGFSARNLKYMRKFAEAWPDRQIVQRVAAQIPWRKRKEPHRR